MRPESITFEAFGSYLERTTVDFSKVGQDGIFLICGSTGGGKTTLLDAITVALYGKATGSLRGDKWRLLRCSLADRSVDTYVEFIFSLGEERYRFVRRWRMSKSHGEDELKPFENACYRWQGQDWGEPLVSGSASAIELEAKRILGLSHDQFVKVICLPQGEFRELLTAKSEVRTGIFEQLFGTSRWRDIKVAASEYCKAMDAELKGLSSGIEALLQASDQKNPTLLRIAADEAAKERDALTRQVSDLSVQLETASKNLNGAGVVEEKFAQLDSKRAELAALEGRGEEIDRIATLLSRHEQLSGLYERYCALQVAREEQAAMCYRYEQCESHAIETACELEAARLAGERLEQLRGQLAALRDELVLLRSLKEKADRLAAAGEEIERCKEEIGRSDARLAALNKELEDQGQRILKGKGLIEQCDSAIARTQEVSAKAAAAQRNVELFLSLSQLEGSRAAAMQQLEKAEREYAETDRQLGEAKTVLAGLEALVSADAAYALSLTLQEGQPCPVCGSEHHPMHAQPPKDIPDKAQLEGAHAKVTDAQAQADKAGKTLSDCRAAHALAIEQYEQVLAQCSALGITAEQAAQQQAAAEEEQSEITRQIELKEQYQKRLGELEGALAKTRENAESTARLRTEQTALLAAAEGSRDALMGELSASDIAISGPEQRIADHEQQCAELDLQITGITERLGRAGVADAAAQADYRAASESLTAVNKRTSALDADYNAQCQQKDIDPGCDIGAQRLTEEEAAQYREQLEEYRLHYATTLKGIRDLEGETAGLQRPQIEELRRIYDALMESSSNLSRALGEATARAQQLLTSAENVESSVRQRDLLADRYAAVKRIRDCLGGTNSKKTPIDQFVAGLLLDEVISSANNYWQRLSRGQYSLRRSTEVSGRERYQGLNFEVIDANIGDVRPISTLSGGELFLASLSLAFGLSDVVQGFSGGLRLESIFIDEGFGSLDSGILNLAIKAISEIREGRIIGIISHVEELKGRITSRIEVSKDDRGSHISTVY